MIELKPAPQAMCMPAFAPMYSWGEENAENVTLEAIIINYETRPEIVEQVLPKPLRPADEPLATAWFAHFVAPRVLKPDGGIEEMTPYSECGFNVKCTYEGQAGTYPLLFFITGLNHGFPGREISGFPKKQAKDISLIRIYDEVMVSATNAAGERVVTGKGKLTEDIGSLGDMEWAQSSFNLKLFPRADGKGYDVNTLVRVDTKVSNIRNARRGTGELAFEKSSIDPLYLLEPVRVREVLACTMTMEVLGGQNLCTVDEFPTFGIPRW